MDIENLRNEIDDVDRQIVSLIGHRLELSRKIGDEKQKSRAAIEDRSREEKVIRAIASLASSQGIDPGEITNIFRHIISASKNAQGFKVGFQGEFGAFSEEAARAFFGPSVQAHPFESLADVFEAVASGEVNYGIIPVENSLEGSVDTAYDLLFNSDLTVSGEVELRISHCLIASRQANLATIKSIYSHPQALGQCQAFIKHLNCEIIPAYDTAGSVKLIKERSITDGAAIASARAAEIYDMQAIATDIQDNNDNFTRFFILGKTATKPSGSDKTSVIFAVKHKPGALYGILAAFAEQDVNLSKLESRPTRQKPWEYNFYMDFDGHYLDPGPAKALKKAEDFAIFIKVLGSYPRAGIKA